MKWLDGFRTGTATCNSGHTFGKLAMKTSALFELVFTQVLSLWGASTGECILYTVIEFVLLSRFLASVCAVGLVRLRGVPWP